MNNYQLNLLNRGKFEFLSELGNEEVELKDTLVLHQNENYKIGGYKIIINNSMVSCVKYQKKEYTANENGVIEVPFEFNNADKGIYLSFKGEIADDCSLPIKAVLANRESFDIKEAEENYEKLVNQVALVLNTGNSLINVFWKKADETVTKTIIKFYYYDHKTKIEYLIEESENNGEFKSFCGLAYGRYKFIIEQYDSKNNLVVSVSDIISLENEMADLKSSLENSLNGVKDQVRASGRNTIVYGS